MNYTFEQIQPSLIRGVEEGIEQKIEQAKTDPTRINGVNLHLADHYMITLHAPNYCRIFDLKDPNQSLDLIDNLNSLKFNLNSLDDHPNDFDLIDYEALSKTPEVGADHFLDPLFEGLNLASIRIQYK